MATRSSTRSSNRGQQTTSDRPPLPMNEYNEMLSSTVEGSEFLPVKFQPIKKESHTIIVGRVKIPIPTGHTYVLRRYDTGSISLTTMWKAAFPTASAAAGMDETNWVKKHFDLSGPPETTRLSGTWLPVPVARQLGAEYRLTRTVEGLSNAEPDDEEYRLTSPSHVGLAYLPPIASETVEGLSKADPDNEAVRRIHLGPPVSPILFSFRFLVLSSFITLIGALFYAYMGAR